jgi:fluoroquinolone resistance protein
MPPLTENETISRQTYTVTGFPKAEYIGCTFEHCDFSKTNLSTVDFVDCRFLHCNFSLADVKNTAFKSSTFEHSKVTGVNFGECNPFMFSVTFQHCILDYSVFFKQKMKKTVFTSCSLKQTDFEETDLTEAVFDNCDLTGANFYKTILEKADLRSASSFDIDPEQNKLKKARLSLTSLPGLLGKYDLKIEP